MIEFVKLVISTNHIHCPQSEHPARFTSMLSLQHCVLFAFFFFFFTFIKGSKPAVAFEFFFLRRRMAPWCRGLGFTRKGFFGLMKFWHSLWEVPYEGVSYVVGAKWSQKEPATVPTPTGRLKMGHHKAITCSIASYWWLGLGWSDWLFKKQSFVLPVLKECALLPG